MSSMGDVDGYSITWFSPAHSFRGGFHKSVSWDVNVTDLGGRQWWEVSIVPVGAKFPATGHSLAGTANVSEYDTGAIVIGSSPGSGVNITTNRINRYQDWRPLCGRHGLDPKGCESKMIRRPFSVSDNQNGSVTVGYGNILSITVPGVFPREFEVYFEGHGYTPDKDAKPVGHTWHWDSIRVE
jgi:hypothetical protein